MASRFDTARKQGYRDESVSKRPPRMRDLMASAAEDWFAQGLGLSGQGDIGHADGGHDVLWRGWRIDVKWPQDEPGQRWGHGAGARLAYCGLRVPNWKPIRADIYVLVIGSLPSEFDKWAWADGWALRSEVLAAPLMLGGKRKTSGKAAPFHFIGFDYLHPLGDLLDIHER